MQPHALLELDFSNKLEITINNNKPVVLTDLTMALLGVGQQFERFIENETNEQHAAPKGPHVISLRKAEKHGARYYRQVAKENLG
jgi:hypothetical protein